ncbi:MAG TPA: cache domain-containing protein [Vicinamibacteria bacterium]|nr:cache domain-containing protein [Vicinamibacteria bacterium]
MAKRRYELDSRVFTIFFLVAIPFVVFGSFLVISMVRGRLESALGASFEQQAIGTKLQLERYVGEQIVHLRILANDPLVRGATMPRATPSAELGRMEAAWAKGEDPGALASLLQSPLASHLRDQVRLRPALRLVQVADAGGRLVASSSRAGRLQNAEASWFRAVAAQEAEEAFVGDIRTHPNSTLPLLEVAYPVVDPQKGFVGGVRALLDAGDLYGVLGPVRVGRTGHAVLVRATDGVILASDDGRAVLQSVFPGFESVQNAIERERRGYWTIPAIRKEGALVEPARVVGFSPVDQVPGVRWLVAVEQDAAEATAPVTDVTHFLWIHFLGAFGSVVLLALYFSFKLERPVIEDELHLHEEHVPVAFQRTGTEG